MATNGYEKIPGEDQVSMEAKIQGVQPPAYAHVHVDEESRGGDLDEEQRYELCSAKHFPEYCFCHFIPSLNCPFPHTNQLLAGAPFLRIHDGGTHLLLACCTNRHGVLCQGALRRQPSCKPVPQDWQESMAFCAVIRVLPGMALTYSVVFTSARVACSSSG